MRDSSDGTSHPNPPANGKDENGSDWIELTRRAALASHRLIGWIYWDPVAIERYTALGPDPFSYYIATRAASLAVAGNAAVAAAFYSISPPFISMCLDNCRAHTTFEAAAAARDEGVVAGLQAYVPEICDELANLAEPLWAAADQLPVAGRVLFATLRERPRPDDPLLSAWLAVNCIREWRGDTHWAIQTAEDIGQIEAGILDGAWRFYADDWLPRSRGADDAALAAAFATLEQRGLATNGAVNAGGPRVPPGVGGPPGRPGLGGVASTRCGPHDAVPRSDRARGRPTGRADRSHRRTELDARRPRPRPPPPP